MHGLWVAANIRGKLHEAKSVKLVHYNPYNWGGVPEIIYGSKDLKPEEFSKVAAAFPLCPDVGFPTDQYGCIFDPHHKIIITDAAGNETVIRVCFLCDHIQYGISGQTFVTPYIWRLALHRFFDAEGVPYTPDKYMKDFRDAGMKKEQELNSTTDTNYPAGAPHSPVR